jgi:hypothetical protein
MALESVAMEFKYKDYFKQAPAVGYETLIYDCLIGDATLFQRADQVEAAGAWSSRCWKAGPTPRRVTFPNYAAGSEGPSAANDLLARDGRSLARHQMSGIAARLEVVKDAAALAARAADIIAGQLRVARIPSAWCCRAARRRAPPISCWRARTDRLGLCRDLLRRRAFRAAGAIPIPTTAWCARVFWPVAMSIRASCWPFPPTARRKRRRRYDETLRQQYGAGTLEAGVPYFT